MNAVERWFSQETHLYLLASVVYFAIGIGYVFVLDKDILDTVSLVGCFVFSVGFLTLRLLVITPSAFQKDIRTAGIERRIEKKMMKAFAENRWYTVAKRCSRIAWLLCGGVLFSYVGFRNIVTPPWHTLLGISTALFTVGAIILVILSGKHIQLSEEEFNQKNQEKK